VRALRAPATAALDRLAARRLAGSLGGRGSVRIG